MSGTELERSLIAQVEGMRRETSRREGQLVQLLRTHVEQQRELTRRFDATTRQLDALKRQLDSRTTQLNDLQRQVGELLRAFGE